MTRGDFGTRLDLLTPADVSVTAARWLQTDGAEIELTAEELDDLHNGPEYDAILTVCDEIRAAEMGDYSDWGEDEL
jgi:hypothetical protein